MGQAFKHSGNRLAHNVNHHQTGKQAGEQRDDQNRFQRFKALRQPRIAIDRLGAVTGDKSGNDPADKPGPQGARQQAADHPRRQARAVGNRVGDVTRQQRHHQFERGITTDLHQRRRQRARFFISFNAKHEGQRDQQTARHHHRQHKGHARQQVFVDAGLFLLGRRSASSSALLLPFAQRLVQCGFGLLEGDTGAATIDFLAGKTLGRYLDICRQQHHIGIADGFGAQRVARTYRPLGLDLQIVAQALGRLLQGFRRHKGVRHARRAGSDGNDFRGFLCVFIRSRWRRSNVDLGLLHTTLQYRFYILQGLGRGALEHPLADKTLHIQRCAADHQHPLSFVDGRRRQLALWVLGVVDFNAGAPALTLRRSVKQAGTQHAGHHAVGAARHNG